MHICVSMNQSNGKIISYDNKLSSFLGFTDQEMSYLKYYTKKNSFSLSFFFV